MVNTTALLFFLWPQMLYQLQNGTVLVPFTHDFNTGLHGWEFEPEYWDWTGSSNRSPDTTNIPLFYTNGNHVWTQEPIPEEHNKSMAFYLPKIKLVTRSTKFTFRYWFSTSNPGNDTGLFIYIMDTSASHFLPVATITDNSENWKDLTIECTRFKCCRNKIVCDVQIQILSSLGASNEDGIASVICVTTEDGCGPLPVSPTTPKITSTPTVNTITMTLKPISTSPPQPAPGVSSLTSTPNVLVRAAFISILFIT